MALCLPFLVTVVLAVVMDDDRCFVYTFCLLNKTVERLGGPLLESNPFYIQLCQMQRHYIMSWRHLIRGASGQDIGYFI